MSIFDSINKPFQYAFNRVYDVIDSMFDGRNVPAVLRLPKASVAPVNAVAAVGTLTFSGVVADGQTVTIGDDVYEFDNDESVTEGNILVDVTGDLSASAAVTALVNAITASDSEPVSAADGAGDTVVITADVKGVLANAIATTETCTNASWGAVTLENGVDGTVGFEGEARFDGSYIYICKAANTISDNNWHRVSLGSAF